MYVPVRVEGVGSRQELENSLSEAGSPPCCSPPPFLVPVAQRSRASSSPATAVRWCLISPGVFLMYPSRNRGAESRPQVAVALDPRGIPASCHCRCLVWLCPFLQHPCWWLLGVTGTPHVVRPFILLLSASWQEVTAAPWAWAWQVFLPCSAGACSCPFPFLPLGGRGGLSTW